MSDIVIMVARVISQYWRGRLQLDASQRTRVEQRARGVRALAPINHPHWIIIIIFNFFSRPARALARSL